MLVQVVMQRAIVMCSPAEESLQITLELGGKLRFMERPKAEALEKTLARMQKNAAPAPGK